MTGYKKLILLGIFILVFFALGQSALARLLDIPDDPGYVDLPSVPTSNSGSFVLTCRADGGLGNNTKICTGSGPAILGQIWEWDYQMIQQDEPAAEVSVCINSSGAMNDGACWVVQNKYGHNNVINSDGNIFPDDFRTFNRIVARINIDNGGIANDGDHTARFNYRGRTAGVSNLDVNPDPIQVFGSAQLSWTSAYMYDQEIIYGDTNGTVSGYVLSRSDPGSNSASNTKTYTNGGAPGVAGFRLKTWGPNENGVYTGYEVDFPELTVLGNMSGTIRSDFLTCQKAGANQCDVVLNYTTTNVIFADIDKDTAGWRSIDSAVIPAGTMTDPNPAPGTHMYALFGQNSGAMVQLASVTVTILPEDVPPSDPGSPVCSPNFVSRNINQSATFTASGGNGVFSWTGGGSPASASGASFTTTFATIGTRLITVTSGGRTDTCTFEVLNNGTPPPPDPTVLPQLVCAPASTSAQVFANATFTATGGNGIYSWTGGGTPLTGTGSSFITQYGTPGTRTITVTSGAATANCVVQVISSSCPSLNSPGDGALLPVGTYQPTFTYNSASGKTNYILDVSTDPSWGWWWNNGTGAAGDGQVAASLPVTFGITTQYTAVQNAYYAEGRAVPDQLQSGVTYYWRVYAFNASDLSLGGCHSATYSFTIASNVPVFVINYEPAALNRAENLTASNSICRQVTLTWTYVNNAVAQGYTVYRSTSGNVGTFTALNTYANLVNRTYVDTDALLVPGQTYYYRVDYYTNVAPARSNPSDVVNTTVTGCTADFSSSTYQIMSVNGVAYNSATTDISDGDTVSFRITLANLGPANGIVTALTNTISDNQTSVRNYQINRGAGYIAGSLNGSSGTSVNFNLTNLTKCVGPNNPTGCSTATDPSCVTSPSSLCNNWVLTFDTTVSTQSTGENDALTGVARLAFTDGRRDALNNLITNYQNITLAPHLFDTDRRVPPDFREVAP